MKLESREQGEYGVCKELGGRKGQTRQNLVDDFAFHPRSNRKPHDGLNGGFCFD